MIDKNIRKDIEKLINILDKYPMSGLPDTVALNDHLDEEEYQWDLWMRSNNNERIIYKDIFDKYVRSLIYNICNFDVLREKGLEWAFIRKYETSGRIHLPAHFDTTCYTINIPLSDPTDYEGGEFLLVNNKNTLPEWVNNQHAGVLNNITDDLLRNNYVSSIKPKMGEIIVLRGQNNKVAPPNLHRVLPLKKGKRYILCLFFDHPELNDMPNIFNKYYNKYNP